jgi:hypothetical protein
MVLQPEGEIPFPWLALITPGAMFLLITLFWQLNIRRYRLFSPLYLAGKGVSIITTMFWLFFAGNSIISKLLYSSMALYIIPGIVIFLLLGDMLSVWMVMILMKINRRR